MKKIVVITGAGISAESGISTFRDSDGMWEKYKVEDVCTTQAWEKNRATVIKFYNERRAQLEHVKPNVAHTALAKLEMKYEVVIVTQNVDDLHERGGSTEVIHLHGQLTKARQGDKIVDVGYKPFSEKSGLRPHIVFFGDSVPMMAEAYKEVAKADLIIVVGTSLSVYPAAELVQYSRQLKVIVDPAVPKDMVKNSIHVKQRATVGVPTLVNSLLLHDGDLKTWLAKFDGNFGN